MRWQRVKLAAISARDVRKPADARGLLWNTIVPVASTDLVWPDDGSAANFQLCRRSSETVVRCSQSIS